MNDLIKFLLIVLVAWLLIAVLSGCDNDRTMMDTARRQIAAEQAQANRDPEVAKQFEEKKPTVGKHSSNVVFVGYTDDGDCLIYKVITSGEPNIVTCSTRRVAISE